MPTDSTQPPLDAQQPQVARPLPSDWDSKVILTNIFQYLEIKDLKELSEVHHKFHEAIKPIIFHSLRLLRRDYFLEKKNGDKIGRHISQNRELRACIAENMQYRELVKRIKLNIILKPKIANDIYNTFCFLTNLVIFNLNLPEELFVTCLRPLKILRSLKLDKVTICEFVLEEVEHKIVKLPPTLTQLMLINIEYYFGNPVLFQQTIVTHTNVKELFIQEILDKYFINPFFKPYPTLKKLTLMESTHVLRNFQTVNIIRSNPQLTEFSYIGPALNCFLVNPINNYLTELKVLKLQGFKCRVPDLREELHLPNMMHLNRLTLHCNTFSLQAYISLLDKIPSLETLNIGLDPQYPRLTEAIRNNIPTLKHLTFYTYRQDKNEKDWLQGFFQNEFSNTHYSCAKNLKTLNFGFFNMLELKPEYLTRFPNLEAVRFINFRTNYKVRTRSMIVKNHLETFRSWGWNYFLESPRIQSPGYLYRANGPQPSNLLDKMYYFWG